MCKVSFLKRDERQTFNYMILYKKIKIKKEIHERLKIIIILYYII
jgi:hypothetical protein